MLLAEMRELAAAQAWSGSYGQSHHYMYLTSPQMTASPRPPFTLLQHL